MRGTVKNCVLKIFECRFNQKIEQIDSSDYRLTTLKMLTKNKDGGDSRCSEMQNAKLRK